MYKSYDCTKLIFEFPDIDLPVALLLIGYLLTVEFSSRSLFHVLVHESLHLLFHLLAFDR